MVRVDAGGGAEIFILEGSCTESGDALRKHSWLRVPVGGEVVATCGAAGATVWIKTNHLR